MNENISNWMMEFLLRNTTVPDSLIQKTLTLLPLSGTDPRLKKTLLLRVLQTHILNASISEASLQILEHLEEIYRNDGVSISNAMRTAYCAVAVECTVKYLINSPEDPSGEYFSAVRRIWRGRRGSGLVSDGFVQWGEEIEGALWDVRVAERLVGLNTRRDAVVEVKRFLKEAWGSMGDSFLDLIAMVSKGNGLCTGGVCENAAEGSRRLLEGLGNEKVNDDVAMGENHGNRQLEENGSGGGMSRRRDGRLEGLGKQKMNDDKNDNVNDIVDDSDDETTMGENRGNDESEERVGTSVDANQEVEQRAGTSRMGVKGVCEIAEGGEDLGKRDGRLEGLGKEKMNDDGDEENDNVDGDDDVAMMDGNRGNEQLEVRVRTSGMRDKEIRKDNGQLKRKHSALQTSHRGVKLSGAEEARPINFSTKYENVRSADVKKLRESLKSSSLELKALVKDPLPDALHTSEGVRSELATKDINRRPASEKQSEHVNVRDSDACKTIVLYQPNDANFAKEPSVPCSSDHRPNCSNGRRPNCSNDRRPNLMRRASSAHTYVWDDSIENLPQQTPTRRKKMKWTSLEEETLRAGVRMFGEGNWRTILDFYSNIFEYRSGVDLKDKWRNMTR